jgi:flavin reductase (DIM6/NTAB) family NADH-FMN oxidoreductase RutF
MEVNFDTQPDALPWRSMYKLMIGSILPRPIGWISTVNDDGQPNLAPFSFFNAVCANPPTVLFCPGVRATDREPKDTLLNIKATSEFVVNIVTEALAEAMNRTATELPSDVNEFEFANLTIAPSQAVRPPRVAESPIHFECKMTHVIDIFDGPGGGSVVIGRVHHVHVDDSVLIDGDKIDLAKLQPIGRLAGTSYCHVKDIFDMVRLPPQVQPAE